MPITARYLFGSEVHTRPDGPLITALKEGCVVVQRLFLEVPHYVLLTGLDGDNVLCFDPYWEEDFHPQGVTLVKDRPHCCNRIIPLSVLDREDKGDYNLGPVSERDALILINTKG